MKCGTSPILGINCGTCSWPSSCSDGYCLPDNMVLVSSGAFWMGCNDDVDSNCTWLERPYHEVTLSTYGIDRTEVTQGMYKSCLDAGDCKSPPCNFNPSTSFDKPVVCVAWAEAVTYCNWIGKRLPTEAEWEKAARGTDGRKYPWGNETATCNYAVMEEGEDGCGTDSTWIGCSKSPAGDSPYGLCDMAGNVSEWVSDWGDEHYYSNSPSTNPSGPETGTYRVFRGGSFGYGVGVHGGYPLRVSDRRFAPPNLDGIGSTDIDRGFRCAQSL